jgi:hypothetical protein
MENKTGKYFKYAIGEIILVVIGILIALQINNWNENRKNSNRETQFLKNFRLDLVTNKEELKRVIKKTEQTSMSADSILQLKEGEIDSLNLMSFVGCMMNATGFTVYQSQEGTIQDILGSGKLDIITNDSLRLAIGSWEANLKGIREWESLDKKTYSIYSEYLHEHAALYKISYKKELPISETIRNQFMEDKVFLNRIRDRKRIPKILNGLYNSEILRIDALIKQIDVELSF